MRKLHHAVHVYAQFRRWYRLAKRILREKRLFLSLPKLRTTVSIVCLLRRAVLRARRRLRKSGTLANLEVLRKTVFVLIAIKRYVRKMLPEVRAHLKNRNDHQGDAIHDSMSQLSGVSQNTVSFQSASQEREEVEMMILKMKEELRQKDSRMRQMEEEIRLLKGSDEGRSVDGETSEGKNARISIELHMSTRVLRKASTLSSEPLSSDLASLVTSLGQATEECDQVKKYGSWRYTELLARSLHRALQYGLVSKIDNLLRDQYTGKENLLELAAVALIQLDWSGKGRLPLDEIEQLLETRGFEDKNDESQKKILAPLRALFLKIHESEQANEAEDGRVDLVGPSVTYKHATIESFFNYFVKCSEEDRVAGTNILLEASSGILVFLLQVYQRVIKRVAAIDASLESKYFGHNDEPDFDLVIFALSTLMQNEDLEAARRDLAVAISLLGDTDGLRIKDSESAALELDNMVSKVLEVTSCPPDLLGHFQRELFLLRTEVMRIAEFRSMKYCEEGSVAKAEGLSTDDSSSSVFLRSQSSILNLDVEETPDTGVRPSHEDNGSEEDIVQIMPDSDTTVHRPTPIRVASQADDIFASHSLMDTCGKNNGSSRKGSESSGNRDALIEKRGSELVPPSPPPPMSHSSPFPGDYRDEEKEKWEEDSTQLPPPTSEEGTVEEESVLGIIKQDVVEQKIVSASASSGTKADIDDTLTASEESSELEPHESSTSSSLMSTSSDEFMVEPKNDESAAEGPTHETGERKEGAQNDDEDTVHGVEARSGSMGPHAMQKREKKGKKLNIEDVGRDEAQKTAFWRQATHFELPEAYSSIMGKPNDPLDANMQRHYEELAQWVQKTAASVPEPKMNYMQAIKADVRKNLDEVKTAEEASTCVQNLAHILGGIVTADTAEVCEFCFGSLVHDLIDDLKGSEFDRRANVEAIRQAFQVSIYPAISPLHSWIADELRLCANTRKDQQNGLLDQLVIACATGPLALLLQRLRGKLKWPQEVLGVVYDVCRKTAWEVDGSNADLQDIALETFTKLGGSIINLLELDHELKIGWKEMCGKRIRFDQKEKTVEKKLVTVENRKKKLERKNAVGFDEEPEIRTFISDSDGASNSSPANVGGDSEIDPRLLVDKASGSRAETSPPTSTKKPSLHQPSLKDKKAGIELSNAPTSPLGQTYSSLGSLSLAQDAVILPSEKFFPKSETKPWERADIVLETAPSTSEKQTRTFAALDAAQPRGDSSFALERQIIGRSVSRTKDSIRLAKESGRRNMTICSPSMGDEKEHDERAPQSLERVDDSVDQEKTRTERTLNASASDVSPRLMSDSESEEDKNINARQSDTSLSDTFDSDLDAVVEMGGFKFVSEWFAKQIELVWRKQLRGQLRHERLRVLAERAVIFMPENRRTVQHVFYIAHLVVRSLRDLKAQPSAHSLRSVAKIGLLEILYEVSPDENKDQRRRIVKMVGKLGKRPSVENAEKLKMAAASMINGIAEELSAEIKNSVGMHREAQLERLRAACDHRARNLSIKQRQDVAQKLTETRALFEQEECIVGVNMCIKRLAIYMPYGQQQKATAPSFCPADSGIESGGEEGGPHTLTPSSGAPYVTPTNSLSHASLYESSTKGSGYTPSSFQRDLLASPGSHYSYQLQHIARSIYESETHMSDGRWRSHGYHEESVILRDDKAGYSSASDKNRTKKREDEMMSNTSIGMEVDVFLRENNLTNEAEMNNSIVTDFLNQYPFPIRHCRAPNIHQHGISRQSVLFGTARDDYSTRPASSLRLDEAYSPRGIRPEYPTGESRKYLNTPHPISPSAVSKSVTSFPLDEGKNSPPGPYVLENTEEDPPPPSPPSSPSVISGKLVLSLPSPPKSAGEEKMVPSSPSSPLVSEGRLIVQNPPSPSQEAKQLPSWSAEELESAPDTSPKIMRAEAHHGDHGSPATGTQPDRLHGSPWVSEPPCIGSPMSTLKLKPDTTNGTSTSSDLATQPILGYATATMTLNTTGTISNSSSSPPPFPRAIEPSAMIRLESVASGRDAVDPPTRMPAPGVTHEERINTKTPMLISAVPPYFSFKVVSPGRGSRPRCELEKPLFDNFTDLKSSDDIPHTSPTEGSIIKSRRDDEPVEPPQEVVPVSFIVPKLNALPEEIGSPKGLSARGSDLVPPPGKSANHMIPASPPQAGVCRSTHKTTFPPPVTQAPSGHEAMPPIPESDLLPTSGAYGATSPAHGTLQGLRAHDAYMAGTTPPAPLPRSNRGYGGSPSAPIQPPFVPSSSTEGQSAIFTFLLPPPSPMHSTTEDRSQYGGISISPLSRGVDFERLPPPSPLNPQGPSSSSLRRYTITRSQHTPARTSLSSDPQAASSGEGENCSRHVDLPLAPPTLFPSSTRETYHAASSSASGHRCGAMNPLEDQAPITNQNPYGTNHRTQQYHPLRTQYSNMNVARRMHEDIEQQQSLFYRLPPPTKLESCPHSLFTSDFYPRSAQFTIPTSTLTNRSLLRVGKCGGP